MKTSASNKKVRELIQMVRNARLIPRPEFQRRLVWTNSDKAKLIDTVLKGYPFPEIYLANGELNIETGDGTQLLVDGQQRVTTLVEYFEGNPRLSLKGNTPYSNLEEDEKRRFLDYDVAVRDLGDISSAQIIEVFKRINSTAYGLTDIEVNNALYNGALKTFADRYASNEFFDIHRVFRAEDLKRMGDLKYVLQLIASMMGGYFNRDDALEELLSTYNDEFPMEQEIAKRLDQTLAFIDECGFDSKSRVWKRNDLFTLIVEIDRAFGEGLPLQPSVVVESLNAFFKTVDQGSLESGDLVAATYYKAAVQASNDRINRERRGQIIRDVLRGVEPLNHLLGV
ncbi:DUF262 domain-containing protein [Rhodoferax aquaticus]|uniref:DUF262 domain-containing protein n=1 Tax=Rhodoferax aquaticus TaxID=2527691 RepID=A0A515EQW4_9BURK|nr:DUF262 domain-containing protein [Rhodoferax aquaticus]QDL55030.1 DUF262 domain-containing protein [Rhodoferax aquaticus]